MRRVAVQGNSGSGKSTLARQLAGVLDVPHIELDAIHHLPGWQPIDRDTFRAEVTACCAADGWVIDGNYSAVRDLVLDAADTLVYLDLRLPVVMVQVTCRTVRRMRTGEELWNGNREQWGSLAKITPAENVVLWSLTRHRLHRRRAAAQEAAPDPPHLRVVRLRSRRAVAAWLASVSAADGADR